MARWQPITRVLLLVIISNRADSAATSKVTQSAGDSAPGARGTVCLGSWFPFEYLRSCVCSSVFRSKLQVASGTAIGSLSASLSGSHLEWHCGTGTCTGRDSDTTVPVAVLVSAALVQYKQIRSI